MSKLLKSFKAVPEKIRMEELDGKEHMVVPTIILVEGVLHSANSMAPELALAEEFGKFPEGWDGRPVLVGHPTNEIGAPISANSPDVWDNQVIGKLFNTKLDGKKLKTEAWVDVEKAKELGFADELIRLESGETVEVSTGLFSDTADKSGMFQGESFAGVWDDVTPDHLAILPKGTIGACSVEDGCGAPRVNCAGCKDKASFQAKTNIASDNTLAQEVLLKIKSMLGITKQNETDNDKRFAVEAALAAEEDFFFIFAMTDDSVILEKGWSGQLIKREFKIEEDGSVTLGNEEIEVRPVTKFEDVRINAKENAMASDNKERVNALIANKATKFAEEDKEWMEALTSEALEKLEPAELTANELKAAKAASEEASKEKAAAANAEPVILSTEDYIKQAPAEMQTVLAEGLRLQRANRTALISAIKANEQNSFSDEQLEDMDLSMLEGVSKFVLLEDYSPAAPSINNAESNDEGPGPMPSLSASIIESRSA